MICTITVYKLTCSVTNEIRYVGITTKPLIKRLASHINAAQKKGAKTHRESWIRGLLNKGLKPIIKELEVFESMHIAQDTSTQPNTIYRVTFCTGGTYYSASDVDHLTKIQ